MSQKPTYDETIYVIDVPIENNQEIFEWIKKGVIKSFYLSSYGLERIRKKDIPLVEKILGRKCFKPSNSHALND